MNKDHKEKAVEMPQVSFDEFAKPTYAEWQEAATKALKGAPFDKKMFTKTYEGITLEPIYTMEHLQKLSEPDSCPGAIPYLRGTDSAGYISHPWEIAQGCAVCDPAEANAVIREDLSRGATEVNLQLDDSVLHGQDVPVGNGLCLNCADDVEKALNGVDLKKNGIHAATGASAGPVLKFITEWAGKHGFSAKDLKGCIGADPLAALARDGALPRSMEKLYDEMAETIRWAEKAGSPLKTVLLRGSVYSDGGASAVQETACLLASAIACVRAMDQRGVSLKAVCNHIEFEVAIGANFFMEIARLRALRALWARVVEAFGGDKEDGKAVVFACTSAFTKSVYDPYVNVLRNATQAFSGMVGGVSGMQVGAFDETVRPASELGRRIARNQQIMLQTEFDLTTPVDPAGGSWYVETLTHQVEAGVWKLLQKIEKDGGMLAALKLGTVQADIDAVLQDRFRKLATRSDHIVGTNMYPNAAEKPLDVPVCNAVAFAAGRADALKNAGTTIGSMWTALNGSDTGISGVTAIVPHRQTEQFEALRKRTEDYKARTGSNVKVFLANMGPIPQHKPRADFSAGFMQVARFDVLSNNGFPTVEEAAKAALDSGADVTVICSTDATYPELVPPLARALKAGNPKMRVFLAGAPAPESKDAYVSAGVDDFIHVKANCLTILTEIQKIKGMC